MARSGPRQHHGHGLVQELEAHLPLELEALPFRPEIAAAVLAYNGKEAVQLAERLFAIPMGHLLAQPNQAPK